MSTVHDALASAIFPHIDKTPADYEAMYPPRALPEGAAVTRIAPSPTGYLHIGVYFSALINRLTAWSTGGVFYFRLEDTDKKREVAGGEENLLSSLNAFALPIDEGLTAPGVSAGDYGPYRQRERAAIYQVYAKTLVAAALAYPCFCTEAARADVRAAQETAKVRTGYYGAHAPCRLLSAEEALARVRAGEPHVLRLRSPGNEQNRVKFADQIRGEVDMPENDEDFVLLKSDGIPTYHFAHAVDDHLMRTTHVIRGDEWIASTPKHLQLFRLLGFRPPKYAHFSPIMIEENGSKRKISKRKDPEAAMTFFLEAGYPPESIQEYLMTIASSAFEDWRRANPDAPRQAFPFKLKSMSVSGALFDHHKLEDVSKNVISRWDADAVLAAVTAWAAVYAPDFHALLSRDADYARAIFAIDRGGAKPRKDLAKWSDAPGYAAYFYDETFVPAAAYPAQFAPAAVRDALRAYTPLYDPAQERQQWFDAIRQLAPSLGFCPDVKQYKQEPEKWQGHAGDLATLIRLAVTGRANTPDLCDIMRLLGRDTVTRRLREAADNL